MTKQSRLTEETERLNAMLREATAAIVALDLGTAAEIEFTLGVGQERTLGFGKRDQGWQIYVGYDNGEEVTLLNASRLTRVRAVAYLPELVKTLCVRADAEAEEVREATNEARAFVFDLQRGAYDRGDL